MLPKYSASMAPAPSLVLRAARPSELPSVHGKAATELNKWRRQQQQDKRSPARLTIETATFVRSFRAGVAGATHDSIDGLRLVPFRDAASVVDVLDVRSSTKQHSRA